MRENTEQMQLPRFLWVPFELGRPFGAPNEADFQRRVLRAALGLLEREDGPVVLEDFPDDAPVVQDSSDAEGWACPVSFHAATDDKPALVSDALAEVARLAPWHEIYCAQRARAAPPASGLTTTEIMHGLGALVEGLEPDVPTDVPLLEWVRLGCDDLRTWYLEAAQGQPGQARPSELHDWFWLQTALAQLIAAAAGHFVRSPNRGHQLFGRRGMVPRMYMPRLMPNVTPSAGEL